MGSSQDVLDSGVHYLGRLIEAIPAKLALAAGWSLGVSDAAPAIAHAPFQGAVVFLMADWVTGTFKGWLTHTSNSDAGVRGAVKSLIYLTLLGASHYVAKLGPFLGWVDTWAAWALIYTEAISNLENLDAIGKHFDVSLPLVKHAIAVLRMKQGAMLSHVKPADEPRA